MQSEVTKVLGAVRTAWADVEDDAVEAPAKEAGQLASVLVGGPSPGQSPNQRRRAAKNTGTLKEAGKEQPLVLGYLEALQVSSGTTAKPPAATWQAVLAEAKAAACSAERSLEDVKAERALW